MAINLSHPDTVNVGSFYTPIHLQIDDVASDRLPPTVAEFKQWLDSLHTPGPSQRLALDAGCGVHVLNSRLLDRAGYDVTALDLNADAVRAARDYDLRSVRGSVMWLPFAAGRFAVVVCSGVAHHTPDPWVAMRELYRVLEPGGRLYLTLYTFAGSPAAWMVRILRTFGRIVPFAFAHRLGRRSTFVNNFILDHMYVPVLWVFEAAEIEQYLASIGFELLSSAANVGLAQSPAGRALTGDGLLRVFVCLKHNVANSA